jgi:hypothetical protein
MLSRLVEAGCEEEGGVREEEESSLVGVDERVE